MGLPRSFDARDHNDVLLANSQFLTTLNRANSIDISQFDYWTFGGEWVFALGDHFDGSLGVGYYQKTVPTVDIYNINAATGTEIFADLKLRIVPFSATVRFLPIGHHAMEPYLGGGVNVYYWRYSETGQFVDYSDQPFGPCPPDIGCRLIPGSSSAVAGQLDRSSLAACACLWVRCNPVSKSGIREASVTFRQIKASQARRSI